MNLQLDQCHRSCNQSPVCIEAYILCNWCHQDCDNAHGVRSGSGMASDTGSASHYPSGSALGSGQDWFYDSGRRRVSGSAGTALPPFYASGSGTAGSDTAYPHKVSFKISLKDLTHQGPWDAAFMDAVVASVRKTIATNANVPDRDVRIHGITQTTNRQ